MKEINKAFYMEYSAQQSRILEEVNTLSQQHGLSLAEALAIIRIQRDDEKIRLLKKIADQKSDWG